MRFDYPGGVEGEREKYAVERFETDVLPYIQKNGSKIGDAAMKGDLDAKEVIVRYRGFTEGMPDYRPRHLTKLIAALKKWEAKGYQ